MTAKTGEIPLKEIAKIQKISVIHPTLGFTEFDILEKYRESFNESELSRLHSVFPFECMAKALGLSDHRLDRRNIFSLDIPVDTLSPIPVIPVRFPVCIQY